MKDKVKTTNFIISTIRDIDISFDENSLDEYLDVCTQVICQFDTDVAIDVMDGLIEEFGESAKEQSMWVKVHYGY